MSPEEREAKEVVGLDPWGLRRIEKLLVELEGVNSLKIVPDGHGGIDEIHVVTVSDLGPKQIVRNIESALLAEFGLQVDHRKISVARVRGPELSPARAAAEAASARPAPAAAPTVRRLVLQRLNIQRSAGEIVSCKVELHHGDQTFAGEAEGPDFERGRLEVAAAAVLDALQQATGEGVHLSLQGISRIESLGRTFVVAVVGASQGRAACTLTGLSQIIDSPEEAAVLACLHATNRWVGTR